MTKKTAIAFVVFFIIGFILGHFVGKDIDGSIKISKTVDSLNVVNKVKDEVLEKIVRSKEESIDNRKYRLKKRNEEFKKDTVIPSNDQLLLRIRAINDKNR